MYNDIVNNSSTLNEKFLPHEIKEHKLIMKIIPIKCQSKNNLLFIEILCEIPLLVAFDMFYKFYEFFKKQIILKQSITV